MDGRTVADMIQEMKGLIMRLLWGNDSDEEDFENLIRINDLMNAVKDKCEGLSADLSYFKEQYIRTKPELTKVYKD